LRFRLDGDVFDLNRLKAHTKVKKITLTEMLFADDAALCANSEEELQIIVTTFYETFKEFGLQLAIKKTEVMMQKATSNEPRHDPTIYVEGQPLKVVQKFKYLGVHLSNNGAMTEEIPVRIQKGAASFSKLYQRIWKKRHLTLKTKIQTYKCMVLPCMLYGSETWNCTKSQIKTLEGTQYRHLRTICGKSWKDKISYYEILKSIQFGPNQNYEWAHEDDPKSTDVKSVETSLRINRLRYAGHIQRMKDNRLPKIMLYGEVNAGQRKPGRPKKSFRECLKEDLKLFGIWNTDSRTNVPELCANRREWRKMIHKGAKAFQQDWEKARLERSQVRKELPNQRNEKVRIKTILI